VYLKLREEIVSGSLEAGAALVEGALAARYETSRTPVREALRRLQQDGLVERAGRGLRVRTRSPEEILEIYDVRIVLEAEAARSAAQRATRLDLMRLNGALDRMKAADPAEPAAMVATNRTFHETIWSASHNATIVDLLTRLHSHLTRYPATTLTSPGRWDTVLREHKEILAAIEARDSDAAAEIARAHMIEARDIRLAMYSEEPGDLSGLSALSGRRRSGAGPPDAGNNPRQRTAEAALAPARRPNTAPAVRPLPPG
jgi:DNA-binding GntR family transcriptional regulator